MDAELVKMAHGVFQIGEVLPSLAAARHDHLGDTFGRELPGILVVGPVGDQGDSADPPVLEPHRAEARQIDIVGDLALGQIIEDVTRPPRPHLVRQPPARAALIEPEHEAGFGPRAAVDQRMDAEGAVIAMEAGRHRFLIVEPRVPHERAVGEYPKLRAMRMFDHDIDPVLTSIRRVT